MNNTRIASLLAVAMLVTAASCRRPRQRFDQVREPDGPWSCAVAPYDSIETFALSPDGQRISFLGKKGGKWEFVVSAGWRWKVDDNARIESDPSLDTGRTLTLSPDGSRVAIVYNRTSRWRDRGPRPADDGTDTNGQWFVDIDHHIFGGFDRDCKPVVRFSADGSKFVFPYKKLGAFYVQVVDTTFGPYEHADVMITPQKVVALRGVTKGDAGKRIVTGGEIILAYIRRDRAYIETIYRPDRD